MSECNGLPKGWAEANLGALLHRIEGGTSFKCLTRMAGREEWGVIKVSAMTWGSFLEDEQKALPPKTVFDPAAEIKPGDLLISRCNTVELVGASVLVGACRTRLLLSDKSLRLVVAEAIDRKWLQKIMSSQIVRQQMSDVATGSSNSMRNISQDKIKAVRFPLPPLPEQQRIVEKIEELFSDLDAGVSALQRAKANLKRYRASVLKSAVEGRLTVEWRKEHPQKEDGQMLLDRILRERWEKWEADQLQNFKEKGKQPPKNWESKYEEPSAPDASELPELPEGWVWATVNQLAKTDEQPVLTGPFGSTLGRGDFIAEGVPLLTIGCLTQSGITLGKSFCISPEKARSLERYAVVTGDILFSRSASVGRAGLVTDALAGSIINYHLMRLRLDPCTVNASLFIAYVRGAEAVRAYLKRVNHGATRDGINTTDLLAMPVALPPLAEQEQIVALVEERLSQIDSAEKTIDAELIRAKRLRQSILKRAFEGKLVTQDLKDEPASILLERIKATREAKKPQKKAKKAGAQSTKTGRAS